MLLPTGRALVIVQCRGRGGDREFRAACVEQPGPGWDWNCYAEKKIAAPGSGPEGSRRQVMIFPMGVGSINRGKPISGTDI
jgi:hypothetical protein